VTLQSLIVVVVAARERDNRFTAAASCSSHVVIVADLISTWTPAVNPLLSFQLPHLQCYLAPAFLLVAHLCSKHTVIYLNTGTGLTQMWVWRWVMVRS